MSTLTTSVITRLRCINIYDFNSLACASLRRALYYMVAPALLVVGFLELIRITETCFNSVNYRLLSFYN